MMNGPGAIRILHVDDDAGFLDVASEFLERQDDRFHVETATSVEEGLAKLESSPVDCVVADYDMPDASGIEFLEAVRASHRDLPFVLFTGKGSEAVASEAISAGVTDYLQKGGTEKYEILANRVENAVERHRAETQRERRLNAIESAHEGIAILDEDWRFAYVNGAYADLYGYDPGDLIGESWEVLYRDEDVTEMRETVLPDLREEGHWHGTTTGLRADGTTFEEDHVLSTTERGELVCAVRELAGDTVPSEPPSAVRDRLEFALDVAGAVAWTVDVESGIVRTQPSSGSLTGADVGDVQEFMELVHPEDRERVVEAWNRGLETGSIEFDCRVEVEEGSRWIVTAGRVEYDEDGTPESAIGVARDATDRKKRARALTALHEVAVELNASDSVEEVCELTIDASEGILDFDISTVMIDDGERLVPAAVSSGAPPDGVRPFEYDEGLVGKTFRTGESYTVGDAKADEDSKPAKEQYRSGISVPIGDRGVFQAVAVEVDAFDETDRRLAELLVAHAANAFDRIEREGELRQQNERLEEFANVVSHDLRNPLEVANAGLELAREDCDSPHLDTVAEAHDRMGSLVADLLTLARQGAEVDRMVQVDLERVAREAWSTVDTAGADLVVEATRAVKADPDRLRQLLENLFRNAVEHAGTGDEAGPEGEGGSTPVEVTVGSVDGGFYVADDGPGIAPDERERVFEAGYSTSEGGTGFGLNIVADIAAAHGWAIDVVESDSGGARFEVTGVESA